MSFSLVLVVGEPRLVAEVCILSAFTLKKMLNSAEDEQALSLELVKELQKEVRLYNIICFSNKYRVVATFIDSIPQTLLWSYCFWLTAARCTRCAVLAPAWCYHTSGFAAAAMAAALIGVC